MDSGVLLNFVDLFVFAANALVVVSILASWFPSIRNLPGGETALGMAEVVLIPARKFLPPRGPLDWSPLITIIALQVLQTGLHNLL